MESGAQDTSLSDGNLENRDRSDAGNITRTRVETPERPIPATKSIWKSLFSPNRGRTSGADETVSGSVELSTVTVLRSLAQLQYLIMNPFDTPPRRPPNNNRRDNQAHTDIRGTLTPPGVCGLHNMGNTCFMNAALQCLAQTPLLTGYLVSGKYRDQVNRTNRLGTGGALTEQLAHLMTQMWTGKFKAVSPVSFKRCLDVTKPMFSGNEQHDAQELLVELLDAIHEDLNRRADGKRVDTLNVKVFHRDRDVDQIRPSSRTIDSNVHSNSDPSDCEDNIAAVGSTERSGHNPQYSYAVIGPSLEDEVASKLSTDELAKYFWDRHLSRNESVMVDLVQGQLRSEVECPSCKALSRTFDPFSCVSLPVPKQQHERQIKVVVFQRLPWLFRWFKKCRLLIQSSAISEQEIIELYTNCHRRCRELKVLSMTLSRLNEVSDLKRAICVELEKKTDVPSIANIDKVGQLSSKQLLLFEMRKNKIHKYLDDNSPLASVDSTIESCCHAFESSVDMEFVVSAGPEIFSWKRPTLPDVTVSKSNKDGQDDKVETLSEEDKSRLLSDCWFGMTDREEYQAGSCSADGSPIIVDMMDPNIPWPKEFRQLVKQASSMGPFGFRLDACDSRAKWCSGSVVKWSLGNTGENAYVVIHFDSYSSKWDEVFEEKDFKLGRICPLYSKCKRKLAIFELKVVLRQPIEVEEDLTVKSTYPLNKSSSTPVSSIIADLVDKSALPKQVRTEEDYIELGKIVNTMKIVSKDVYIIQLESFKSCESAYRHIIEQVAARYLSDDELRQFVKSSLVDDSDVVTDYPFEIRLISVDCGDGPAFDYQAGYSVSDDGKPLGTRDQTNAWEGTIFPRDDLRPMCNLYHNKLAISVDWKYSKISAEEKVATEEERSPQLAEERAKIVKDKEQREVTIYDCLRSYSCDEVFEENTWYCGGCKTHRRGVMRACFYRLPDILIIHIKRFNMTARWREKIRTKVVFPIDGLDMAEFTTEIRDKKPGNEPNHGPPEGMGSTVYDLYGVVNHIGGMSGGHYTAAVRYFGHPLDSMHSLSPPSPVSGGVQDLESENLSTINYQVDGGVIGRKESNGFGGMFSCCTQASSAIITAEDMFENLSLKERELISSNAGQWFLLDDESACPISDEKAVTANAYVLFYRRRVLSSSNIVSMS